MEIPTCKACGLCVSKGARLCLSCARTQEHPRRGQFKHPYPTKEELELSLNGKSIYSLAKELNLPYNTFKKHLIRIGLKSKIDRDEQHSDSASKTLVNHSGQH
jgi:DNA-binding CsgD family transcriptional regulator